MFTEELLIILIGATPISELRGAIPIALGVFDFAPAKAYMLAVAGNLLPIVPAFLFFHIASRSLMKKSKFFNRIFAKLFEYTRKKYQFRFEYEHRKVSLRPWLEALTLFLFVAVPLPFTGIWTATIVAFVFGVPIRRAFLSMTAGVLFSGAAVLGISLGIINII